MLGTTISNPVQITNTDYILECLPSVRLFDVVFKSYVDLYFSNKSPNYFSYIEFWHEKEKTRIVGVKKGWFAFSPNKFYNLGSMKLNKEYDNGPLVSVEFSLCGSPASWQSIIYDIKKYFKTLETKVSFWSNEAFEILP